MNKIDIEKLGVAELSQGELCSVNGGSDFTKALFETAGYVVGGIANAIDAVVEYGVYLYAHRLL